MSKRLKFANSGRVTATATTHRISKELPAGSTIKKVTATNFSGECKVNLDLIDVSSNNVLQRLVKDFPIYDDGLLAEWEGSLGELETNVKVMATFSNATIGDWLDLKVTYI